MRAKSAKYRIERSGRSQTSNVIPQTKFYIWLAFDKFRQFKHTAKQWHKSNPTTIQLINVFFEFLEPKTHVFGSIHGRFVHRRYKHEPATCSTMENWLFKLTRTLWKTAKKQPAREWRPKHERRPTHERSPMPERRPTDERRPTHERRPTREWVPKQRNAPPPRDRDPPVRSQNDRFYRPPGARDDSRNGRSQTSHSPRESRRQNHSKNNFDQVSSEMYSFAVNIFSNFHRTSFTNSTHLSATLWKLLDIVLFWKNFIFRIFFLIQFFYLVFRLRSNIPFWKLKIKHIKIVFGCKKMANSFPLW